MTGRKLYRQSTLLMKLLWFLVMGFFALLLPFQVSAKDTTEDTNWLTRPVTLEFSKEPLHKVLDEISKQAEVSIVFDESLANELVTGRYNGVKTTDALNRIFKGKNSIVQVDVDKMTFIVKTFGAKKFIRTGEGNSSTSIALTELNALHTEQYQEFKESLLDQRKVLDEGITRAELNAMNEQQYNEYKASIANEEEILEEGLTRAQMRSISEQQYQAYQGTLANQNQELIGGITREQLNAMNKQQYQEYRQQASNKDSIVEGLDMPMSQLENMHQLQYADFNKNRANKSNIFDL